jgi:hypothetical protein
MGGIKENPEIADKLSLVLRGEKISDEILGKEKTTNTDADAETPQGEMAQVSELPAQPEVGLPTESESDQEKPQELPLADDPTGLETPVFQKPSTGQPPTVHGLVVPPGSL